MKLPIEGSGSEGITCHLLHGHRVTTQCTPLPEVSWAALQNISDTVSKASPPRSSKTKAHAVPVTLDTRRLYNGVPTRGLQPTRLLGKRVGRGERDSLAWFRFCSPRRARRSSATTTPQDVLHRDTGTAGCLLPGFQCCVYLCFAWLKEVLLLLHFFFFPVKKNCVDFRGKVKKGKVSVRLEFRRQGRFKQSRGVLIFRSTKYLGKGEWGGAEARLLEQHPKHGAIICLIFQN